MPAMYELAGPFVVQWVQTMTKWDGFYVYWSLVWTRRLPEGIMVIHQTLFDITLPIEPKSIIDKIFTNNFNHDF